MAKKTVKAEDQAIAKAVDATFEVSTNDNETVESRVEFEIKKFNIADARIAELKEQFKGLEIKGVDDKEGIKAVTEAAKVMRTLRTGVDAKHKELKAFYLNTGRGIDAEKNRIQELIAEVEEPLKAKKDAIDAEIQRIKDEEEAREQKRIEDRVDALKAAGIEFDGTFYSIGESVSVDLLTIKDLDNEAFEKLKSMVQAENEKIQAKKRIDELHENRKEHLLQFWSFVTEEQRQMNFGELTNEAFTIIVFEAQQASENFEAEKQKQVDEEQRLIQERKDFNFEKRSFKLEKIGFEIDEKGNAVFLNQIKVLQVSRNFLETATNETFEAEFESMVTNKKDIEERIQKRQKEAEQKFEAEAQKKASEEAEKQFYEKWNSRISSFKKIGFEHFGNMLVFDSIKINVNEFKEMTDDEFSDLFISTSKEKAEKIKQISDKEEKERLQKLPDFDKIERYCEELMNVAVPQLASPEAQKELQLLRSELKLSVEKTLSNIKLLK